MKLKRYITIVYSHQKQNNKIYNFALISKMKKCYNDWQKTRSGLLNWRTAVRVRTFRALKLDLKLQDE